MNVLKSTEPFVHKTIEENTGFLFLQMTNLWHHKQEKMLKLRFNISQLQNAILMSIYWLKLQHDDVTQSQISLHMKIDRMTLQGNLQALVEKRYITSGMHSTDKRAKSLKITDNGLQLLKQTIDMVEKMDMDFFKPLGRKLARFNSSLIKIIDANE